jgi:hypothetical protein
MMKYCFLLALLPMAMGADLISGPQLGQRPGPYSFLVATGPNAGQPTCFICETDAKPAAIVFSRKLTPNLVKLLTEFDNWVSGQPNEEVYSWMTVLGEKTISQEALSKWSKEAGLRKVPVGVFDDPDGPPAYKLSKDAEVTVLLFVKRKVVANYALKADELNEKVIASIKQDLSKLKK